MISFADACDLIACEASPLPTVHLPLGEVQGLFTAEPLIAIEPLPTTDNSAIDGYAVRSEDTAAAGAGAPLTLRVVGEATPSQPWPGMLGAGEAVRLFTGAPIPAGADGLVMVEHTQSASGGAAVELRQPVPLGAHIRPAGGDVQPGDLLLNAGELLGPGAIGVLGATGHATVPVVRRPRVAVMMSGDELVEPTQHVLPGQVRDVSSGVLMAALRDLGVDAVWLGRARDSAEDLHNRLLPALQGVDMVLTAGGVSMGQYDLLRPTMKQLGFAELLHGVAQRPGKPLTVGRNQDGTWWFGLPGNPVSVWTCFQVYVIPTLRRLMGNPEPDHPLVPLLAGERMDTPAPLTYLLRARLEEVGGRLVAYLTGPQGSNITTSMRHADVIVTIPPETSVTAPGQWVEAMVINPARFTTVAARQLAVLRQAGGAVGYMGGVNRVAPEARP